MSSASRRVLTKIRRACELWNAGERALAHIFLAHAGLPACDEERALRLFVADELLEAVTPAGLMQAQGFDPAPLALLKFNPDQPRVPAGGKAAAGPQMAPSLRYERGQGGQGQDQD